MLSVCLAEVEKHKGDGHFEPPEESKCQRVRRRGSPAAGSDPLAFVPSGVRVITAPANLCVRFTPPLALPRSLTIEFWEASDGVCFRVQDSHLTGLISRS